jgi:hypothetical protein
MVESAEELVAEILTNTVTDRDIPAELQAAAESLYQDVGIWFGDHLDSDDEWTIYPQGSQLLGTAVRPYGQDDFDLDAVALCNVDKDDITQAELKGVVGDGLISYVDAHAGDDKAPTDCEEGRRCWTLVGDHLGFHMDFLPAIPDPAAPPTGILLSDRDLFRWQFSNPIAFADWFHGRSYAEYMERRATLAKSLQVNVEDVPSWQVRTTLQQGVQALKLHRNIYFADDLDSRPPSVLLTTLAGHSYRGQKLLFDAVMEMVSLMPNYIERDGDEYVVLNPVQPNENFADRWGKQVDRPRKFFAWLRDFQRTLEEASKTTSGLDAMVARLGMGFGADTVKKAASKLAAERTTSRRSDLLSVTSTGAITSRAGIAKVRDHTFHGD